MSPVTTLDPAPAVVRDVASEVASLAGVLNTVMARLVEVTAAAIAAGETDEAGMRTPAAWLAWRSGLSPEHAGLPVSVGRTQYIVPDRTRRVVERRDRGCRVPGCTAERFVEIHHIVHWEDGGPTDTWNLLCLCAHHHRMHHKGELGIAGDADRPDGIEFTDARGRPIPRSHPPEPPPAGIPDCERPYQAPPAGRVNYDWVGLGWAHPNALKRRRDQANRFHRD